MIKHNNSVLGFLKCSFISLTSFCVLAIIIQVINFAAIPSQATYSEIKGDNIYTISPITDEWTDPEFTSFLIESSVYTLATQVKEMNEAGLIPKQFLSTDDLDQFTLVKEEIKKSIKHLSEMISNESTPSYLKSFGSWSPKAIMVFLSEIASFNLKVGVDGMGVIGIVIMPVTVVRTNIRTGEVSKPYFDVRTHFATAVAGGLGAGLGGGIRTGLGAMVILGGPHFTRPEQFWGTGVGLSQSASLLGVGVDFRQGILFNSELPDAVDFLYFTASWQMGVVATMESHVNGIVVSPIESLLKLIGNTSTDKSEEASYREYLLKIEEKLKYKTRDVLESHSNEPPISGPGQ